MEKNAGLANKMCVADMVYRDLVSVAELSMTIESLVKSKLSRITPPEEAFPTPDASVACHPYPPLFADYQVQIDNIRECLNGIAKALEKAEI